MDVIAQDTRETVRTRRKPGLRADVARSRELSTAAHYEVFGENYASQTLDIDVSRHVDRFARLLKPGARVLDAGCGAGRDLLALARAGLQPEGIDSSSALVGIARRLSGLPITLGDLRAPPYDPASFEGVWAMASLLHLERDETTAAIRALGSLLVPGGIMFASVKRGAGTVGDEDGRWFTLFDEVGWSSHLSDAGLEVLEVIGEPPGSHGATGNVRPGWISSLARRPA